MLDLPLLLNKTGSGTIISWEMLPQDLLLRTNLTLSSFTGSAIYECDIFSGYFCQLCGFHYLLINKIN